ncbi:ski2-like helicase [Legionella sainthelensi]|uniref:Ski2-like helicase n=1 Tax=Legionella sainthelensi TaxID=28087 RepID=A0A0W0YDY4_9GAMM|nr:DEAD/DEAH box helicase [Legionella sainthelensi]KTD54927.1 ski2-like helicase [Legionella sainthelensi]VEH37331.1 ski2-like helicase [Legionella sainthelensi]
MSDWLFDILGDAHTQALKEASRHLVYKELSSAVVEIDFDLIRRVAEVLELAVRDIILNRYKDDEEQNKELKKHAANAFQLYRVLPPATNPLSNAMQLLQTSSLAVIGDMGAAASRMLREIDWPKLPMDSSSWRDRTWAVIIDVWLRLIRKQGWADRDAVLQNIAALREAQEEFEQKYLNSLNPATAKIEALELIGLYHLAKTAEIFALYLTDGAVDGNYQVQQLLDTHFDRVFEVCKIAPMIYLEPLSYLLSACAAQMVENSIWTVTRAVNSRVTQFVRNMVARGRGQGAIFEMLPPQRRTLADKGLLGSSRRAVVVSLPTSSGKTLIAQFRILQALNQFDYEQGWIAYLVPTRTLVNQITRQLRRDFLPLDIIVEQISPALEIDNIEMDLLQEHDRKQAFRVLVTTPEKLDLMLRQGWEEKIGRPLTLVVVDEAHNIQSSHRGLKLELLLSTINKECQRAQFLLLTPFIKNAKEIARWLGGPNSDDISLSLDWQPNDRVIGIVQPVKDKLIKNKSYDYKLNFESIHTSRNTLVIDDLLTLPKSDELAKTYSKVCSHKIMAAVTAQFLHKRGPVIVMHARPDWVWLLADTLKIESNRTKIISKNILLVQEFLQLEFGNEFPLIELLTYKIGIHHAGLSDDVRALMEWLFEENELNFLVATTTIAQGVNFPVTGIVMASHQYPSDKGMTDMPPEDFWNIAGRAGRIGQESLGVIALVADSNAKAKNLKKFINNQTGDLNSALLNLAIESKDFLEDLEGIVYRTPEWSSFLQYLTHTYRQMGKPDTFVDQVEQVLRGTFGFEKLRMENPSIAKKLLSGIQRYAEYLKRPNQPLKLVDSTGFSLQSINTVLKNKGNIDASSWDPTSLFQNKNATLQDMMGILLRVPELRENFQVAIGGEHPDGEKLSLIIKDWVNGVSIFDITNRYFRKDNEDLTIAMTKCGQSLFGRLTQTASWGLGALLSITVGDLPEEQYKLLNNLPSRVYYGVNDDSAIALRLLGIPRTAAIPLASSLSSIMSQPLPKIRGYLRNLSEKDWKDALGESGKTYRDIWRVLEGLS